MNFLKYFYIVRDSESNPDASLSEKLQQNHMKLMYAKWPISNFLETRSKISFQRSKWRQILKRAL